MEWINLSSGISPKSNVILVFNKDKSYEIIFLIKIYKNDELIEEFYTDNSGNKVDGKNILCFLDIPKIHRDLMAL